MSIKKSHVDFVKELQIKNPGIILLENYIKENEKLLIYSKYGNCKIDGRNLLKGVNVSPKYNLEKM